MIKNKLFLRLCLLGAAVFSMLFTANNTLARPSKVTKTEKTVPVKPKTLKALYKAWFQSPYEYMFEKKKVLTINGTAYGRFTAGVNGLVFYSGFKRGAEKLFKNFKSSFDSVSVFQKLSGVPVILHKGSRSTDFKYYNPIFIRWGIRNFIVNPNEKLGKFTYQEIYTKLFSRFFRIMVESYLYTKLHLSVSKELTYYKRAVKRKRYAGIFYLKARFDRVLPKKYDMKSTWGVSHWTTGMAIGFWLRRHEDGTGALLWEGLNKFMRLYDKKWFLHKLSNPPAKYKPKKRAIPKRLKVEKYPLQILPIPMGPGKNPLSAKALHKIYKAWFKSPYKYMFGNKKVITIRGKSYGIFEGGIRGILYYGSLKDGVDAVARHRSSDFMDIIGFQKLSGFKVIMRKAKNYDDYNRYNPAFVRWGVKNFIPSPNDKVYGHTYQQLYTKMFAPFFRLMFETYKYLAKHRSFTKELILYKDVVARTSHSGITYLNIRFNKHFPGYKATWTAGMAAGFWLRRHDDGTRKEFFRGLYLLLLRFDTAWLTKKMKLTTPLKPRSAAKSKPTSKPSKR